MHYYLSIGSNTGEREACIAQSVSLLGEQLGEVVRCSSCYYSPAWGYQSEHEYCNICCLVLSPKEPLEALHITQSIERQLGRTRKTKDGHYEDRPIDIDLIRVVDDNGCEVFLTTAELTLPHPLYRQRDFVLTPLAQILP